MVTEAQNYSTIKSKAGSYAERLGDRTNFVELSLHVHIARVASRATKTAAQDRTAEISLDRREGTLSKSKLCGTNVRRSRIMALLCRRNVRYDVCLGRASVKIVHKLLPTLGSCMGVARSEEGYLPTKPKPMRCGRMSFLTLRKVFRVFRAHDCATGCRRNDLLSVAIILQTSGG